MNAIRHALLLLLLVVIVGLTTGPASADPPRIAARTDAQRESTQALRDAELAGHRLLSLLDQARLNRNSTHARCVDQRLAMVNSFTRTLEQRHNRLVEAEVLGQPDLARHERMVIRRLLSQLREAEREGRACVFPDEDRDRRTIVTVQVDREVPSLDLPFRD